MARGDSNLLFNPPRLSKKEQAITGPRPGYFEFFEANRLFLMNDITIVEDDEGDIFALDQEMKTEGDPAKISSPRIHEGGLLVASEAGIAFGDHGGFVVHSKIPGNPENLFKDKLPGELLGLHLARHGLYCFWEDEDKALVLSSADIDPHSIDDRQWKEITRFNPDNKVVFQNRGENSMILSYREEEKEKDVYLLTADGQAKSATIGAGSFARTPKAHLITPAEEGFFALERGQYGDEITWISEKRENGFNERKRIHSFIGSGLDNKWHGIASYKNRGALLGVDKVVLFSGEDPDFREEIALDPVLRGFNKIEMNAERVLLWREESSAYLEIPLA